MARPKNTHSRQELLAKLTPVQRYSWDALLSISEVARWLGKATMSIARYRWDGFPPPAGRIPTRGARGGQKLEHWRPRKGKPGWRPADVLRWLETTGRLQA
jgi:hypothetical protein